VSYCFVTAVCVYVACVAHVHCTGSHTHTQLDKHTSLIAIFM